MDTSDMIDSIFKPYDRNDGPGCTVGVVQNGEVVFEKGYGIANLEYDIPITPTTVFDIASVSKQFAGMAISTLIQQGKISLDDDIRKYVPEVPAFGKVITIRHLVHHTSGLRDWPETLHAAGWGWDDVFSFEDIMRMVKAQRDLDFEPGEKYSYSNTGYTLMAEIVAKVSGKSFAEWTDENVFKPLQMNSSRFQDDYTKPIKNLAYSYTSKSDSFQKGSGALTAVGSSSMFTSLEDLCKWVIHFDKQIVIKDPAYLGMLNEGILNNGEKVHYGYGLATGEDRGLKTLSHTGSWDAYRTVMTHYPEQKLSIIILSNSSDFDVRKYSSAVADIFLKGQFKTAETEVTNWKEVPTVSLDPSFGERYAGTYQLELGRFVTLTWENGVLMTQASNEEKFPTLPKSDSVVWVDAYDASISFVEDENGEVNALKYKNKNAKRVVQVTIDTKEFAQYAGTYYSEELAAEYKMTFANDRLSVYHMRIGEFDLTPDATGENQFGSKVGTIRFVKEGQKVTGFLLSGGRIKNIRFDRR